MKCLDGYDSGRLMSSPEDLLTVYDPRYFEDSSYAVILKKSIEVRFNRSKIFLLYFYEAYDVDLCLSEKISRETRFIHAEQMSL